VGEFFRFFGRARRRFAAGVVFRLKIGGEGFPWALQAIAKRRENGETESMSQLTRDRLLAALGVPRLHRDELGELSYEGRADLLGFATRLVAISEPEAVVARCEMRSREGADWSLAWSWRVQSGSDGRLRLADGFHVATEQLPATIEGAKALARAAILQIRRNPIWTSTGLAAPEAMSRFAALADAKDPAHGRKASAARDAVPAPKTPTAPPHGDLFESALAAAPAPGSRRR
jgi:hypothetical protein